MFVGLYNIYSVRHYISMMLKMTSSGEIKGNCVRASRYITWSSGSPEFAVNNNNRKYQFNKNIFWM